MCYNDSTGSLKLLHLSSNTFTGIIPSQLGQLQGASVLLRGDSFTAAPLSLCTKSEVKEFDLENDEALCPIERNALSNFFSLAKGKEWTNDKNWLDEYQSHCKWYGVTCDEGNNHVTKLNLTNNGLSGKLSKSIGKLTYIQVLDLSDNDIKVIAISSVLNAFNIIDLSFFVAYTLLKLKQHRPSRTQLNSHLIGIDSNTGW